MLWGLPPILRCRTALAQVAEDTPPHVSGGDPHAAGSLLLASQAAQGDKAVPTKGCDSLPVRGVSQDKVFQWQGQAPLRLRMQLQHLVIKYMIKVCSMKMMMNN